MWRILFRINGLVRTRSFEKKPNDINGLARTVHVSLEVVRRSAHKVYYVKLAVDNFSLGYQEVRSAHLT